MVAVGELFAYLKLDSAQFDRGITQARTAMTGTAGAAEKVAAAVTQSEAAFVGAGQASGMAAKASARYRAAQLSAVAASERFNTVLAQTAASQGKLAAAEARLVRANEAVRASAPVAAIARTGAAAEASASRLSAFGTSALGALGRTAKMGLGLGAAFGVFELIKKAIDITKEAASYQASMTRIRSLTGASTDEITTMSAALLKLSPKVATGPEELATSLYHMEAVGLRGKEALDGVTVAAKGAKIGNANLEETTNALTSTIASGIVKNQSFSATMGQLLTVVGSGDMKMSDFNEALSSGLMATMANSGVSLRDLGAALAVFGDNNIRGANAATMLTTAVQAMQSPAKGGAVALESIGLNARSLRDDLQSGGLNKAVGDLRHHLDAAGVTGKEVGGFLVEAFGKRANKGIGELVNGFDKLEGKYVIIDSKTNNFGRRWNETSSTTAFALARISTQFNAAGVSLATKLTPAVGVAVRWLSVELPQAVGIAQGILAPMEHYVGGALVAAWKAFGGAVGLIAVLLKPVVSVLESLKGPLGVVATMVLGMWVAFKAGSMIPVLIRAVEYAMISGAAAVYKLGVSAVTTATEFVASSRAIVASADATAVGLADAGAAAEVGWAELLGPIAAVGIGVALLVSMFHHSKSASKEATEAAKAYTEALLNTSGGAQQKSNVLDAVVAQMSKNNVPQKIETLNKALGSTKYFGSQFVNAVSKGPAALKKLQTSLEAVVKAGTSREMVTTAAGYATATKMITKISPAAKAAAALLADLHAQYDGLSKATHKELIDTAAFSGNAAAIQKTTQATIVGSDAAKQYAGMMGIAVSQNGVAAVSAKTLNTAVDAVASAYNHATQAGSEYLAALNAFAGSAGTAADRATMIGATLKAANGDALQYAGSMAAAGDANRTLTSNMASAAAAAFPKMKGAVKGVSNAVREYADRLINLKTGTIDYHRKGAGSLISDLTSIQSAAMSAASATFQHARATMSGKDAADAAYAVYKSKTSGSLVAEASQLGLTAGQAKILADKYFGIPGKVKTAIETEGTDPVVTVLNKIGAMLAALTGGTWGPTVTAHTSAALNDLNNIRVALGELPTNKVINIITNRSNTGAGSGHGAGQATAVIATGGTIIGPGTGTSDSIAAMLSNGEEVIRASQAHKHRPLLKAINAGVQGFAAGGTAGKARADAAYSNAQSAVGITVGILPPNPSALHVFEAAVKAATRSLSAAASAGVSAPKLNALRSHLQAMVREANSQLSNLRVHVNGADMDALKATLMGTATDAQSAFNAMLTDAKNAGLSASRSATAINQVHSLYQHMDARDALRNKLGSGPTASTAYDRLGTAQSNLSGEKDAVSNGVKSYFNVSTAGTPATGDGPVTFATMSAQQTQAKTQIVKWAAGIKKLVGYFGKSAAGKGYLKTLAEAGPSSLPQVTALLSGGAGGIASILATEKAIDDAAGSVAGTVGGALYGGDVSVAQAAVKLLQQQIAAQTATIQALDTNIKNGIRDGLNGLKIVIDAQGFAKLVATGGKKNKR